MRKFGPVAVGLVATVALLIAAVPVHAEQAGPRWSADFAVATKPGNQGLATIAAPGLDIAGDGAGGAVIVWEDHSGGLVHAQRLSPSGAALWPAGGVLVAPAAGFQWTPRVVADGSGGAVVSWLDGRNNFDFCGPAFFAECDVYAQRLDASGRALWAAGGVAVSTAPANQGVEGIVLVSDGAGGAILAWGDARPPDSSRIYAQRLDGAGHARWAADGIAVSVPPTLSVGPIGAPPRIASDGAGGAIVAWLNWQRFLSYATITVQRLDPVGAPLWAPGGIDAALPAYSPFRLAGDGAGGALLAFQATTATPSSDQSDVRVQRVSAGGALLWGDGAAAGVAPGNQGEADVLGDGAGGAFVAWNDGRNLDPFGQESCCDVYGQHLDPDGAPQWPSDGLPIVTAPHNQTYPLLAPDGAGGVVVVWKDCRMDPERDDCLAFANLYAQRVASDGTLLWTTDGVFVSAAAGNQGFDYGSQMTPSHALAPDGAGGAIAVWPDGRTGGCFGIAPFDCDVYAQRVPEPDAGLLGTMSVLSVLGLAASRRRRAN